MTLFFYRYQCFKSAWMYEVFHSGFSFPVSYNSLKTALQVYDKEVQWTLGAILYRTRFLPLRYPLFSQMSGNGFWMEGKSFCEERYSGKKKKAADR